MAIGTDYPRPITVNGYICRNCDDVSSAKKGVDPAQPATGEPAAVSFGGSLGDRQSSGAVPVAEPAFRLLDRYA